MSWRWRHNERDSVSNQRRLDYLLNRLYMRITRKTSKLRVTGLCEGNPPVTGRFPSQRASNVEMFPFDDVFMYINVTIEPLIICIIVMQSYRAHQQHNSIIGAILVLLTTKESSHAYQHDSNYTVKHLVLWFTQWSQYSLTMHINRTIFFFFFGGGGGGGGGRGGGDSALVDILSCWYAWLYSIVIIRTLITPMVLLTCWCMHGYLSGLHRSRLDHHDNNGQYGLYCGR